MKREINSAIKKSSSTIDEIFLFREMAKEFNHGKTSKCTYVHEIHGTKGLVTFTSAYKSGGTATVELGDLLILTFDKAEKKLKMCVMQVKYRRGRYRRFLSHQADLFQWELLLKKPNITNKNKFNFPDNILNFRSDYKSITAFGIFYEDIIGGGIDFLYTLPEFINPRSTPPHPVQNGNRSFYFDCPISAAPPLSSCIYGITPKEALSTCSIDTFEKQVLSFKVGALIEPSENPSISSWVWNTLKSMRDRADDPEIINEVLEYYKGDDTVAPDAHFTYYHPSAFVIITDSELSRNYDE